MADVQAEKVTLHLCKCDEKSTTHVHCKCQVCDGKAVPTTTAWRHRLRISAHNSIASNVSGTSLTENQDVLSFPTNSSNESLVDMDEDMMSMTTDNDSDADITKSDDEELDSINQDVYMRGNCFGTDEQEDVDVDNFNRFLEDAILRLVDLKAQHGYSISAFEDILKWGGDIYKHNSNETPATKQWPRGWGDVIIILKRLGYTDAKCYWICLDNSHPSTYSLLGAKEDRCKYCGKFGTIPYYYLSVLEKVKRWCKSPAMCKKMTAHWLEKDHWLNSADNRKSWGWTHKNEIWDGTRFAELSYFWDPNDEFVLPEYCPHCNIVVSATDVVNSPTSNGIQEVICPGCFNCFQTEIKTAYGDPRNIAYIGKY